MERCLKKTCKKNTLSSVVKGFFCLSKVVPDATAVWSAGRYKAHPLCAPNSVVVDCRHSGAPSGCFLACASPVIARTCVSGFV